MPAHARIRYALGYVVTAPSGRNGWRRTYSLRERVRESGKLCDPYGCRFCSSSSTRRVMRATCSSSGLNGVAQPPTGSSANPSAAKRHCNCLLSFSSSICCTFDFGWRPFPVRNRELQCAAKSFGEFRRVEHGIEQGQQPVLQVTGLLELPRYAEVIQLAGDFRNHAAGGVRAAVAADQNHREQCRIPASQETEVRADRPDRGDHAIMFGRSPDESLIAATQGTPRRTGEPSARRWARRTWGCCTT